jgi:hypothetical protein
MKVCGVRAAQKPEKWRFLTLTLKCSSKTETGHGTSESVVWFKNKLAYYEGEKKSCAETTERKYLNSKRFLRD